MTYCNCKWHHVGDDTNWICEGSEQAMVKLVGPSLKLHSEKYHDRYGTELELVERQDAELQRLRGLMV